MPLLFDDHWVLGLVCRGDGGQLQSATWDPSDDEWKLVGPDDDYFAACTYKHALQAMQLAGDTACGAMPEAQQPHSPELYKQVQDDGVSCGILVFMQALLQMSEATGTHLHLHFNGDHAAARTFLAAGIVEGRLPLPQPQP